MLAGQSASVPHGARMQYLLSEVWHTGGGHDLPGLHVMPLQPSYVSV
jgi:hypothetical protein